MAEINRDKGGNQLAYYNDDDVYKAALLLSGLQKASKAIEKDIETQKAIIKAYALRVFGDTLPTEEAGPRKLNLISGKPDTKPRIFEVEQRPTMRRSLKAEALLSVGVDAEKIREATEEKPGDSWYYTEVKA